MKIRFFWLAAIALCSVSALTWAADPAGVPTEDRQQIADLVSRYAYTYDSKDVEGFVALFTQDCLWESYAGAEQKKIAKVTNRDELRSIVSQRLAMMQQKGIQSRHYQTNTLLTARSDGQVEGTTMLNLVRQVPGAQPMTATTGIYRDVFVRTTAGWRFAKRSLYIDQVELPK